MVAARGASPDRVRGRTRGAPLVLAPGVLALTLDPMARERVQIAASLLAHPFLTGDEFRAATTRAVNLTNRLVDARHALVVDGETSDGRWTARVRRARDRAPYAAGLDDLPDDIGSAALVGRCISDAVLCGSAMEGGEFLTSLVGTRDDEYDSDTSVNSLVRYFRYVDYVWRPDLEAKRLFGLTILGDDSRRSDTHYRWNKLFRALPDGGGLVEAGWHKRTLEIAVRGEPLCDVLDRWVAENPDAPTGVIVASALTRWMTSRPPAVLVP